MLTFLKILLAVFISIIILILLVFFWLKRKVGRFVKNAMAMAELMPPMPSRERLTPQSRLDLEELEPETLSEDLLAKKRELSQLGYQEAGVFSRQDGAPLLLFMHPERPVFVILGVRESRWCLETLVLDNTPKAFWQREQGRAEHLSLSHLELTATPTLDLTSALQMAESPPSGLRPLRAEQFVALYERVSAMEADRFLGERPTLNWLRANVPAEKAQSLTEAQWQELQTAVEAQWKSSLDAALQDEAQRKLAWTAATSDRLASALVIVHRHTSLDDLEAAFAGVDLVDQLIKQLQAQRLSDRQIFDEVNQRLEPADKLVRLVQLTTPIPADVYLPSRLVAQVKQPDAPLIP